MKQWLLAMLLLVVCVGSAPAAFIKFGVNGPVVVQPPPPYAGGPGDIVTYTAAYGTRAYSKVAASNGAKLMNVCYSSGGLDVACADLVAGADGTIQPQTLGGFQCPGNGGTNCTVATLYDLTGNGFDLTGGGSPTNISARPTLQVNAVGTRTCLAFNGSQYLIRTATSPWGALPGSVSWVAMRTGGVTGSNYGSVLRAAGNGFGSGFDQTANKIFFFTPGVSFATTQAANDNAPHSALFLYNGNNSATYVDGHFAGNISQGTSAPSGNITVGGDPSLSPTEYVTGNICEVAYLAGDQSANVVSLYLQQANWYGFTIAAPTVTMTSPSAGNVQGTINVTANCLPGCTSVALKQDGATIATSTAPPYFTAVDTTTLTNGSNHTYSATGINPAGTVNAAGVTVTINNPQPTGPVITLSKSGTTYTPQASALTLDGGLTVTDPTSNIGSATVQITSLGLTTDTLACPSCASNSISATYNASASGGPLLNLSGTATPAAYQAALASVTYVSSATDPTNGGANATRTVTWIATEPAVTGCSGATCKTYYIATNGSDSNNGLSPSTAWATPHGANATSTPIRCSSTGGDTILVQPGTYSNGQFDGLLSGANYWPIVDAATCTSHGVFRTIKCNGTTLGACIVASTGVNAFHWQFWLDSSYWIVQGFQGTNSISAGNDCFVSNFQPNFSPYNAQYNAHDVIWVNNWCHDTQRAAFSVGDYSAIIGGIGYNNAGGSADSGIDMFEPWSFDTLADTHIFTAGAFIFKTTPTDQDTDSEGIIMDDWIYGQCHPPSSGCQTPYTGLGVISQSMFIGNASEGIEKLNGGSTASWVYSTTFWNNNQNPNTQGNAYVEVGSQSGGSQGSILNIDHVLAVAIKATNTWHTVPQFQGSTSGTTLTIPTTVGGNPYGFNDWIVPNAVLTIVSGGVGTLPAGTTVTACISGSCGKVANYTISCPGGCPASTSATAYLADGHGGPNFQTNFPINALGTNNSSMAASNTVYINSANPSQSCNQAPFGGGCSVSFTNSLQADPLFAAPAIPGGTFSTGLGGTGPDCSTFATTTACMRSVGVIANFVPTNSASVGSVPIASMGYPDPNNFACGTEAAIAAGRWPTWIPKSIYQNFPAGLVVTPC